MMGYFPGGNSGMAAPTALNVSHTARRFFRWSGTGGGVTTPSSGQDVDGVAAHDTGGGNAANGYLAHAGLPLQVESGASFFGGAGLATDGSGRAVQAGAGDAVVARALEAASAAGEVVWAVFASGR